MTAAGFPAVAPGIRIEFAVVFAIAVAQVDQRAVIKPAQRPAGDEVREERKLLVKRAVSDNCLIISHAAEKRIRGEGEFVSSSHLSWFWCTCK